VRYSREKQVERTQSALVKKAIWFRASIQGGAAKKRVGGGGGGGGFISGSPGGSAKGLAENLSPEARAQRRGFHQAKSRGVPNKSFLRKGGKNQTSGRLPLKLPRS